jgi:uncharacterized membrane protein
MAQDVFKENISKKEYVFIGSIQADSLKVFNSVKPIWIKKSNVEQVKKLSSKEFLSFVLSKNLKFVGQGDEPFWKIEILKNKLIYFDSKTGKKTNYGITLKTNDSDIDNSFSFMFSDAKTNVYGILRSVGLYPSAQKHCQLCIAEEISLYEVFIHVDGKVFKGCATIISM